MSNTHALTRTSPKGGEFIGTCIKCGTPGLTLKQSREECENPSRMDFSETLGNLISAPLPPRKDRQ